VFGYSEGQCAQKSQHRTQRRVRRAPLAENSEKNSEKRRGGNPENLRPYRFKKGQSGNAGGRPRSPLSDAARRLVSQTLKEDKQRRNWAELMVLAMAKAALKGNVQAFAVLADRIEGKVVSKMELGGPQGGSIPIEYKSPEENEARLAELLARHRIEGYGSGGAQTSQYPLTGSTLLGITPKLHASPLA
jgi:hypothetical protein